MLGILFIFDDFLKGMILLSFSNVSLFRTYMCGSRNIFYSWGKDTQSSGSLGINSMTFCAIFDRGIWLKILPSNSNVKNYDTLPRECFKIAMAQNYGRQRTINIQEPSIPSITMRSG